MGVSKSRKVVRPRLKTELSSRQFRILTKGGSDLVRSGGVVGGGAADSTTESDEPGECLYLLCVRFVDIFSFLQAILSRNHQL